MLASCNNSRSAHSGLYGCGPVGGSCNNEQYLLLISGYMIVICMYSILVGTFLQLLLGWHHCGALECLGHMSSTHM